MTTKWPVFVGSWNYESYLVAPTVAELASPPGSQVSSRKWAKGKMEVGDNVGADVQRELVFAAGIALEVNLHFEGDEGDGPFVVTGTGTGMSGPLKGVIYQLSGWALVENETTVKTIQGAVRLAAAPGDKDPSGALVGVVGFFSLTPAQ